MREGLFDSWIVSPWNLKLISTQLGDTVGKATRDHDTSMR